MNRRAFLRMLGMTGVAGAAVATSCPVTEPCACSAIEDSSNDDFAEMEWVDISSGWDRGYVYVRDPLGEP